MPGALDGIRILDFTRFQQGPFATVLLSDLGADVIKVEERFNGDLGRSLGLQPDGWCTYFESHNRNKRSITVDVRTPEGREIIHRFIPGIDVVVDNFRPGVMARYGLDWDSLSKIKPTIITATASGFGPAGPAAGDPSFDVVGQGVSGMMTLQGGGPGSIPRALIGGLADQVGGMILALGITAAIAARERLGVGQHVDTSLLGSQLALQGMALVGFLHDGQQPATVPRTNPLFTHYACEDGLWLTLGILDPRHWPPLAGALDRADLVGDPRFETPAARHVNRLELVAELEATFATRPRGVWLERIKAAAVPCGPVNDFAAVVGDPQVIANDYITTLDHPSFGKVGVVGSPIRMSRTPSGPRSVAPELGQHTEEELLGLGYGWEEIEQLKTKGVI